MEKLKIALVQMKVIPGKPKINVDNMLQKIEDAKKQEIDLIVFPEMCVGGYLLGDKWTDEEFCLNLMSFNDILMRASEGIAIAFGNIFVDLEIKLRTNSDSIHPNNDGRIRKYNSIYVFQNGKPVERVNETNILPKGIQPKTLLPNYRIFDDQRYFYSTQDIARDFNLELQNLLQPFKIQTKEGIKNIGFELCEDLWCEDYRKNLQALNPTKMLVGNGAELIVNCSASPWTFGKNASRDKRVLFIKEELKNNFKPFLYVNCVGTQNNGKNIVTFDGGSTVYNDEGLPIIFSKAHYIEELIVVDGKVLNGKPLVRNEKTKIAQKYEAIIEGLRGLKDISNTQSYPGVVIGLSGGIDSSLVACLIVKAFGKENVIGVNMPTRYNSDKTKNSAKFLAEQLGIKYFVIPIEGLVEVNADLIRSIDADGSGRKLTELSLENIQAKIRGTSILSNLAARYQAIFTNNGNKLETAIGYATLYGDVGGAIAPIADLTKIEIIEMARFINNEVFNREVIPKVLLPTNLWIFDKDQIEPSAELKNNQVDPMKFIYHCALLDAFTDYNKKSPAEIMQWYTEGILHKKIDFYLKDIIHEAIGLELMKRWNLLDPKEFIKDLEWFSELFQRSVFKRIQAPPIIMTSKTSFGYDLRESMLPYEPTRKQEELKNLILTKMQKYEPKK